jgi:hypothetical protein
MKKPRRGTVPSEYINKKNCISSITKSSRNKSNCKSLVLIKSHQLFMKYRSYRDIGVVWLRCLRPLVQRLQVTVIDSILFFSCSLDLLHEQLKLSLLEWKKNSIRNS